MSPSQSSSHKQASGQWLFRGHAERSAVCGGGGGGGRPAGGNQSDEDLMISSFVAIDSRVDELCCGCLSDTQQISRSAPDENVRDQ